MINRFLYVFVILSILLFQQVNGQKDPSLALTPPMGWNSWNIFAGEIDEIKLREIADIMVSSGLRDAGYVYLNIDDNWMAPHRDPVTKRLVPDPKRFPNGIKALADYVHARGLKLGIYGDRGVMTCLNVPESGSEGFEDIDAKTFAEWEVDYLKYDNCNAPDSTVRMRYKLMSKALRESGRPIVFSVCEWGAHKPVEWAPAISHLWRTTDDITDSWLRIIKLANINEGFSSYASPGGWNDPDMLEVGNGGCTFEEYKTHFSLWCIMAAPLIAGCDLRKLTSETKEILLNKELIAVDQDSAGLQGRRVKIAPEGEIWVKNLGTEMGTEKAVVLFNPKNVPSKIKVEWPEIGLRYGIASVRNLWTHKDEGEIADSYTATIPPHGCVALKVKGLPNEITRIPQVTGIPLAQAKTILSAKKLKIGTLQYIYSESYPENFITKQLQLPGKNVYTNTTVDLIVSKGIKSDPSKFLFEMWKDIQGGIDRIPVEDPADETGELDSIFIPEYSSDIYGVRIRSFLCPPQTGNYSFFIAANDFGEVWLSTDSLCSNKRKICSAAFIKKSTSFDESPSQKSLPVFLKAGAKYYMEIRMKENWSEDFLNVGWQLPDGTIERPIKNNRLWFNQIKNTKLAEKHSKK